MDWAGLIDELDARLVAQSTLLEQARTVEASALTVFRYLGIDVVSATRDGRVQRLGPAATGLSAVVPLGGSVFDAVHMEDQPHLRAAWHAVCDDGVAYAVSVRLLALPEGPGPVHWTLVTLVLAPAWSVVEALVDGLVVSVLPAALLSDGPPRAVVPRGEGRVALPLPATRAAVVPPPPGTPDVIVAPASPPSPGIPAV
jgi:hypothetical protein